MARLGSNRYGKSRVRLSRITRNGDHHGFQELSLIHICIGELPHDGPAPAILNAIRDATGVGFNTIPLLPEDLFIELSVREPQVETATV